ncbi:phage terminase large subunit family protein [Acinetobacter ursingii]|uniref:phage terminase large subunit family protein n=1 Tax=Acinetobacter ursingii TaxID=108980 RepID=UPI0021CDAA13|nr:phage terminase large subunit family protein [Acinetobacter ursingii]MCU4481341.1 phage terminase large subunit family protein [Acinetobacter ursingii]MCU4505673.1 phage terminase large subunit family protein [Acinetobacter ursingii]MCU4569619.1 phage terminase large subunit family protein [Acinetobacter ursingii]
MSDLSIFSNFYSVMDALKRSMEHLVPPPDIKPSVWAEKNIKIPAGNAIPGPINFDNAPYQRGMIDAIKEYGVRRITYMTGAQLGKTTIQQCATGYFIAHEPKSQIFVQPTQGDVQTFLETKLRPMIEANNSIAQKMAKPRSRDGVNNSRMISYIGGWLMFSWAGSPKTLRSRSAPITHADEIDGMEATAEGDPVELLSQRSATFGDQALRTESSTPTVKGASRVESAYYRGDRRRYYVPCPKCGEAQYLKWENVYWDGRQSTNIQDAREDLDQEHQVETAGYRCECCQEVWSDGERIAAIRNAEKLGHGWKAELPYKGHISFHAPEMLSTFRKMSDIVQSYLDKLALDDLQVFVNVSLGETFEENADKVDADSLQNRAEEYKATVPLGGVYLTCGIDMQMDRLELEIVAWGVGEESWSIDYRVLWGDPLGEEVWQDLDDVLEETYMHESGSQLNISAACLDTGGTNGYTQAAYEYIKSRRNRKLFAIKGRGGWGLPIVQSPQRKQSGKDKRKIDLFIVGTDEAKLVVTRRLTLEKGGPGYCHFPIQREAEWYKQLTAEKLVLRYIKGQPIREWHKPDRARNEGLDCRVYALAALKIMQPNLKRIMERLQQQDVEPIQENEAKPVKNVAKVVVRKKSNLKGQSSTTVVKKKKVFGNRK